MRWEEADFDEQEPRAKRPPGDKAPDFTLAAPGGKQVKLGDLTGKGPVVIYTFIQAFTGT